MIQFTAEAERQLEGYLQKLRSILAGCPSIDIGEVERDVLEHIENSLADAPRPVDEPRLDGVLKQLGSPNEWVVDEEFSWRQKLKMQVPTVRERARQFFRRLYRGPEDYRLAYLSIIFFGLAPFLLIFAPVAWLLSFFFARAALSLARSPDELGARKWLVYPILVLIYVPLALLILFWTIPYPLAVTVRFFIEQGRPENLPTWSINLPIFVLPLYVLIVGTALWWAILGWVTWRWPGLVRNTFYPFANSFTGRSALALAIGSTAVLFVGLCAPILLLS